MAFSQGSLSQAWTVMAGPVTLQALRRLRSALAYMAALSFSGNAEDGRTGSIPSWQQLEGPVM